METILKRIQHICEDIFILLDKKSLLDSRLVNHSWKEVMYRKTFQCHDTDLTPFHITPFGTVICIHFFFKKNLLKLVKSLIYNLFKKYNSVICCLGTIMYGVKLESLCINLVKRFWFFDFLKQAMTLPKELEFQDLAIFSGHKKPQFIYIFDYEFLAVEMQSQVQYRLQPETDCFAAEVFVFILRVN